MPSNRQIKGVLLKEDFELFKMAMEKYDLEQADLMREIIHSWLFANKITLECEKWKYKKKNKKNILNLKEK